jgi:ParB family chromosome partitioning protein
MPLLILAVIAACYEHAMTDGEGRATWRTDRHSPCPRESAGAYLTFLAGTGYQLSAIEQAVAGGVPYGGENPDTGADPATERAGASTSDEISETATRHSARQDEHSAGASTEDPAVAADQAAA